MDFVYGLCSPRSQPEDKLRNVYEIKLTICGSLLQWVI